MKVTFLFIWLLIASLICSNSFGQTANVSLSVDVNTPGYRVNEDFVGFSMEQYTLSTGYWGRLGSFWQGGTNGNTRLKNLLKNISDHSIIRLGGFTADDRMVWQNTPRGASTNIRATYSDDTDKFFTFLSEIGWKGIYTINLPINTPANAVSEATYIYSHYAIQLHSLSLGNEPYLYTNNSRDASYNPETYMLTDYLPMYDAIKAANPAIPISGGDNGARKYYGALNQTWNKSYTDYVNNSGSSRPLKGLNVHSYGLGNNASVLSREAAADTLMNFNNAPLIFSSTLLPYVTQLAQAKNVPLRFSETSSVATGTTDTTSIARTFVTALWAMQYLYTLASKGVEGVNFHSSGSSVYSAIDWGPSVTRSDYKIGAIYYGLLAFTDGAKNQRFLTISPPTSTTNPRGSYFATTSDDGKILKVTLINKDFTGAINASVNIPGIKIGTASYQTLKPQTDKFDYVSTISYANAKVASDGTFTKGAPTLLAPTSNTSFSLTLAPMTAVVVTLALQGPPVAGSGSNTVPNAGGTNPVSIPASTFTNTVSSSAASPGTVTSIRINAFPANTTSLTINATAYTPASAEFSGPTPAGITVPTDGSGNPTVPIAIDPTNDTNPVSIAFVAVDNLGTESASTGTAVLTFVAVPDLTAVMYTRPSSVYGTSNFTVVVDLIELNNVPTNGLVTVYITKDSRVNLSFNPTAITVGNRPVQNSAWSFDGSSNSSFYILTTSQVMAAGDGLSLGLNGVLTPGSTKGSVSISSILLDNSGGEVRGINNSDADKVNYFPK